MTIKTKLFLILGGLGLLFLGFSQANAITPFLSAQVGSGAASGTVLTTNGVTSTWATIPNGGGSGSLTTSTPFFNYGVTYNNNGSISASSSLFVSTSTGQVSVQNLETTRYADQFSGSDIGVKINNAETALCAASGGGTIMLPAGQLPFTTSIVISGCPTQLVGQGGGGFYAAGATTLLYNGTGTAYTYNVAGYSSAGIGIFNLSLIGPAGVYSGGGSGIGSSNIASSYGITAGGFAGTVSSAATSTNLITYSAIDLHFANGQAVTFSGGSLPGGISAGTTYYISSITATTFAVYTNVSLATQVTITSNGTGSFTSPSNGIFGLNIEGVQISGFGTGLMIGTNASFLNMTNSVIQKNGRNIDSPQVSGANGENMRVSNSILADSNSSAGSDIGASISNFCVDIQTSGNVQWTFQNTSFDDCQVYSNQFGGTSNNWNFTNDHFEDPNTGQGAYNFIAMQSSTAATNAETWNISNSDFMQDFTSGAPNEYIRFGGTLNLSNVVGDINNNVSSPMNDFATPLNNQTVISWNNLSNKGFNSGNSANTGFTNVYASTTFSQFGLGFATSTPAVSFTTSTILFQGASSTIKLGVASKFPGCIELYDAANSSTVNYIYSSSTALVDTATKPNFCQ